MGWCTPEGVNDTLVLTLWLFHDRQLEPMTKKLHFADIHRILSHLLCYVLHRARNGEAVLLMLLLLLITGRTSGLINHVRGS